MEGELTEERESLLTNRYRYSPKYSPILYWLIAAGSRRRKVVARARGGKDSMREKRGPQYRFRYSYIIVKKGRKDRGESGSEGQIS